MTKVFSCATWRVEEEEAASVVFNRIHNGINDAPLVIVENSLCMVPLVAQLVFVN